MNINRDETTKISTSEPSLLSLSVLVTREEYGDAFVYRKCKESKTAPILILLVGAILICFGMVGILLSRMGLGINFSVTGGISLIIAGIGGVVFSQFFMPVIYRGEAVNDFDNRADLQFATIYEFKSSESGEYFVRIKNGWVEGEIPISFVTGWIETPTFILFSISREIECAIPKRLLDEKQRELLLKILSKTEF